MSTNYKPEDFLDNHLSIIPIGAQKMPVGSWKKYQTELMGKDEARKAFNSKQVKGLALICGPVSHNLECLDLDMKNDVTGKIYPTFKKKVQTERPDLYNKLVIASTRNNGYHWVYRCSTIEGGKHLARRPATKAELAADPNEAVKILIETRGEGQYFVTVPSNGYTILQNDITTPPRITPEERDYLFFTASGFNTYFDKPKLKPSARSYFEQDKDLNDPLTAFSEYGNVIPNLEEKGWTVVDDTPEHITLKRPGNTTAPHSAYYFKDNKIFYVHSTSTTFEANKGYNQAMVYAHLYTNDEYHEARKLLEKDGFGDLEAMKGSKSFLMQCALTDEMGDANLIEELFVDSWCYNIPMKQWMYYEEGKWVFDEERKARLTVVREIIEKYNTLLLELKKDLNKLGAPKKSEDQQITEEREKIVKTQKTLKQKISRLQTQKGSAEVMRLAQEGLSALPSKFDRNPYHINLKNGVYDAKLQKLLPHSADQFLSQQMSVEYDPSAQCLKWEKFLGEIFEGDVEVIEYVQKSVGYTLTGDVSLQSFWFCYGDGANGKSTFLNVIFKLMGDYSEVVQSDILTRSHKSDQGKYEVAKLSKNRFAMSTEIAADAYLKEDQVKTLTSNESITARQIYKEAITFDPTHKIWMAGNYKPLIRGTDAGIWRRVNLIPFEYTVPKEKRRSADIMMAEFKAEFSGILNWGLEGLKSYIAEGTIKAPNAILLSNAEYEDESDTLQYFLEENFDIQNARPGDKVKLKDLYSYYSQWAHQFNYPMVVTNTRRLANILRKKGYTVDRSTANQYYVFGLKNYEKS